MVAPDLLQKIKDALASGKTRDSITTELIGTGVAQSDIMEAFSQLQNSPPEEPTTALPADSSPVNPTPRKSNPFSRFISQNPKYCYPTIVASVPVHPNRVLQFPIFGYILKAIICIPVEILSGILLCCSFIIAILNWFIVVFTGKFNPGMFQLVLGALRLNLKIYYYLTGLTDKYPGFKLEIEDTFTYNYAYPEKSSRFLAIPLLGYFIRGILLIPFLVYQEILSYTAYFSAFIASFFAQL